MKKRNLIIGGLLVVGVSATALGLAACDTTPPEEEVPVITESIRYTEKTNPYAELTWQQYADINDWNEKEVSAPVYYQFEGSYSEAYQGNYSRDYLYMNCYEDGSVHGKVRNTANSNRIEDYFGYWTNVNSRGKESLVLHILSYNGGEYNSGMYDIVCDTKSGGYYDFESNIAISKWGNQRTMSISGYHYSPVKSLSVTTSEESSNFILNDSFSTKGLVVTVNRENGKSIAIDEESYNDPTCRVSFSGFESSEEGDVDITVKYINTEIETTYKVSVMGVSGISVDASDGKTTYHVGDSLDKLGLKITATRTDGKTVAVAADSRRCEFEGFDASEATDSQTITVKLDGEYTATYDIKVVGIKSLEVNAAEAKKEFFVGDNIDTTNLVVKATFADDVTDDITVDRCTIKGFDSSSAVDSQTLTVGFQGLEKTYTIKIVAPEFSGNAKISGTTTAVKIKVVTPDELTYSYNGNTLNLNYRTMNVGGKTIYNLSLPKDGSVSEETFNTLHKQYILDKTDFSLAMSIIYEIPSTGDGDTPGTPRYENEPHYIGGGTEQRFIIIDEEAGTATITYKYWFAGQTDTFVCKYTLEGNVLTLTECVSSTLGWGGASFAGLHKTWTLKEDGTALRNPARVPDAS